MVLRQVAVRDDRPATRQTNLPAVGVAGEDRRDVRVLDIAIENALVGRVHEPERDIPLATAAGEALEVGERCIRPIEVDVRVVDADGADAQPARPHDRGRVREVDPSEVIKQQLTQAGLIEVGLALDMIFLPVK